MPRHENAKIRNIHFYCCSDAVSAVNMTQPLAQELCVLEKDGIEAYDVLLDQPVLVVAPLMCIMADNPCASELVNHLGSAAKKYCHMCMVRKLYYIHILFVVILG